MEITQVEKAKDLLRESGYYVDNLWQTKDVMDFYECTDEEEAYLILNEVMTSEKTAVNIFEQIGLIVDPCSACKEHAKFYEEEERIADIIKTK